MKHTRAGTFPDPIGPHNFSKAGRFSVERFPRGLDFPNISYAADLAHPGPENIFRIIFGPVNRVQIRDWRFTESIYRFGAKYKHSGCRSE